MISTRYIFCIYLIFGYHEDSNLETTINHTFLLLLRGLSCYYDTLLTYITDKLNVLSPNDILINTFIFVL